MNYRMEVMFMKKVVSLLLAVMMLLSVVAVGAVSASAADVALKAGSRIFFDNSNAGWNQVYFYAWNYGFFGDFVPMDKVTVEVPGEDEEGNQTTVSKELYSIVVPVDVPEGAEYFLFTDSTDWNGHQTKNQTALTGVNTYTPTTPTAGRVTESYTEYPVTTEVAITPYSKQFTDTIDVTVYAFNLAEGEKATYSIDYANASSEDVTDKEFTEPVTTTLAETATVTVTAGNATETCKFTKVADAVVNVTARYESGADYTGPLYVYTFGGDRVGSEFNLMNPVLDDNDEPIPGKYTYSINGSAQVIFTTGNDWDDQVNTRKFLIYSGGILLENQEPLVTAGESEFTLVLPAAET